MHVRQPAANIQVETLLPTSLPWCRFINVRGCLPVLSLFCLRPLALARRRHRSSNGGGRSSAAVLVHSPHTPPHPPLPCTQQVMTIDFLTLTTLAPFWMANDAALRKWDQRDSLLPILSVLPVFGPIIYLCLRPKAQI